MSRMSVTITARMFLLIAAMLTCFGQGKTTGAKYYAPHTLPSSIRQVVAGLGIRVQRAGQERVILTGTLDRKGTVSSVRVVRELPGYLRIDETGAKNNSIVFNLKELTGAASIGDEEEDLAEMLESDSAEGFLALLEPGATMRKLGDRFKVKGESGFGSVVDVYEGVGPVKLKRDKKATPKHYLFDSDTGLLRRVVYGAVKSGRSVAVQTVLSDYSTASGYALPGRIVKTVDGVVTLTFALQAAAVTPAAQDGTFTSIGK